MARRIDMTKPLTLEEIEDKIWAIESQYPKHLHIDLDKNDWHPYDRTQLIRLYRLQTKRSKERGE